MNAPIWYNPGFFPATMADGLFDALWTGLKWVRHPLVPRREYYVSLNDQPYTYGKGQYARTYQSQDMTPALSQIWGYVGNACECDFDVVFLNGYEDSSDHLGWHADDSPEMDDARPIAIVSFGAEREIWFRPTPPPRVIRSVDMDAPEPEKLLLQHGSLCMMQAGMQDTHQHRIPKAGREVGPRISLTFRGLAP